MKPAGPSGWTTSPLGFRSSRSAGHSRSGSPSRPIARGSHRCEETRADAARWWDTSLVQAGLQVFEDLASRDEGGVLLATDLHAGNVLAAEREPWLVIDPKPFIGDPACDATQHLLNCEARLRADPVGVVTRFAELLDVDAERVRL